MDGQRDDREGGGVSRRFRFSLRLLFITTAVVALLAFLLMRSWHHAQARRAYLDQAGAVGEHVRTMQGYRWTLNRSSVSGILFNDGTVTDIKLYPGSYSADDLKSIHKLFPEADISDYQPAKKN
jgi:hypothetical protein